MFNENNYSRIVRADLLMRDYLIFEQLVNFRKTSYENRAHNSDGCRYRGDEKGSISPASSYNK